MSMNSVPIVYRFNPSLEKGEGRFMNDSFPKNPPFAKGRI
jgi:hypothetical protein